MAVSPDGSRVFVTGALDGMTATAAYTSSGTRLWLKRFDGDPTQCCADGGDAIAVSPDGGTAYVTGQTQSLLQGISDQVTIAYDAATGDDLWTEVYDRGSMDGDENTDSQNDYGFGIVVSPDGGTVFTAGEADIVLGDTITTDYNTLAYDAATGDLDWQSWYDGGHGGDFGRAIDIGPDGAAVYVTGFSDSASYSAAATVAYDTSNGDQLWAKRYEGPAGFHDSGLSLDVSTDGASVFTTGGTGGTGSGTADWDMFTAGYDTADGGKLWSKVMAGRLDGYDFGRSVMVSPDGTKVFTLGHSLGESGNYDITTVAYALSTGTRRWVMRAPGPAANTGLSGDVGVTPDGSKVLVGSYRTRSGSYDYLTLSYTAAGAARWAERYDGGTSDRLTGLAVSPNGGRVYVTGGSDGLLTLAYKT